MPVEGHASARPSRPLFAEGLPATAEDLLGSDVLSWRQERKGLGGEPGALDWLLDVAAGVSPVGLRAMLLHPARPVRLRCSLPELDRLWRAHLTEAVPLQYLVGRCYWRDFSVEVGPGVLIPRPETETMVDLAVALLREDGTQRAHDLLWADLGTGSGCLAMGLARAFPGCRGLAVDVSPVALGQARRNLSRADPHSRVHLIQGDWFEAIEPWWGALSLVVANPPYIPSEVVDRLDPVVRDHEPRLALDGGGDGLACIRSLAMGAPRALAAGGWLLLEHHHDQSRAVMDLLVRHGLVDVQSHPDLEGQRRFVSGRLSPSMPRLTAGRRP
jgi:release factor glutamine methyltransferase